MDSNTSLQHLAAAVDDRPIRAVPVGWQAQGGNWEPEPEQQAIPLSHYLWVLRRHRWKILSFIVISVVATLIVSKRLTPIYEATATVDVDRRTPMGVIGQEAAQSTLNDADQFLATQVKLIQSDSVLRPVAEQYRLRSASQDDSPTADQARKAEAPVALKDLKVTRPPNTYLLLISYRSSNPRLAADVANGVARSYVEHTYNIRFRSSASLSAFMEKQLEELKAKMERSDSALAQFERELNVINPEEKTNVLAARLLQLNTDYTNAQTERLKKEAAFRSVSSGTIESAQASTQGDALKKLTERLDEAQVSFAQAQAHYGTNHPEYRKAETHLRQVQAQLEASTRNVVRRVEVEYREAVNREAMLGRAVAEAKTEFDRINARSFEYQALKHEADADKKLYEELITKVREAGINAGFQSSTVRIADNARPGVKPVFPNIPLNLALALLISSLFAVGAAVLADVLDNAIRDPEQARRALGVEVVGSLPMVKDKWRGLPFSERAQLRAGAASPAQAGGAGEHPDPVAASFHEAVCSLRNAILLGSFDVRLKSLLLTSAVPSEGKSTTAVHLAIAHAKQRHKTLLIDADLRRPSISRTLGIDGSVGLATAMSNGMLWRQKLQKLDGVEHLDILTAGNASRLMIDLVGQQLPRVLSEAAQEYDLVIVDAPPLLGFPEPLQLAAAVDGVVIVSLAGQTSRQAISSVVASLKRVRANVVGLVLNEVSRDSGTNYGYYGYYDKYSRYYQREKSVEQR